MAGNKKLNSGKKAEEKEKGIRLNKYLSDAGVCSRREADRMIEAGRVRIDDHRASVGERVIEGSMVYADGKQVKQQDSLILLALNKPAGIECTCDRTNPDNIIDFINYPKRLIYVGRLDKNSSGLILMTNDGELANRIAKSSEGHEKEYVVRVSKRITSDFLEKMAAGVPILDTVTRPCELNRIDDYTFGIVLTQGLNRQIRRMCETLNYKVTELKRVRVMNIRLNRLKEGTYRRISESEIMDLMELL